MKSSSLLLAGLLLTTVSLAEPGQDASPWPQFRGPDGQGHSTLPLPTTWAEDKNVAWKTPLPGKGWSSPVVAGGKAWVTTAVTAAGGGGTSLRFLGVDLKTGKLAQDVELFNIAPAQRPSTSSIGCPPGHTCR